MSVRTIKECDRCHGEISPAGSGYSRLEPRQVTHKNTTKDLCGTCASKLDEFMAGQELEVPP